MPDAIPKLREPVYPEAEERKPLRKMNPKYLFHLEGQRFGKLLVIEEAERVGRHRRMWRCVCDCGDERIVQQLHLRKGATRSCGSRQCKVNRGTTTHGQARGEKTTTEYRIWSSMKTRCSNPARRSYARYGGRGIKVCDRWSQSFEAFLADMGPRPSRAHTIDRIDNDGNYEPSNCRWATQEIQVANKSRVLRTVYCGQDMRLVDAARLAGVPYRTAVERLHKGVPIDQYTRRRHNA